jgi:VWFA-related protein
VTILVSGLLLALAAPVPTQVPSFAVGVEAVYLDVFVTKSGRPVTGLQQADFELRDGGERRDLELVAVETLPLRMLLVFDTSASVDGKKLAELQAAGLALLRSCRAGDEAALVTFGHRIRLTVEATSEPERVARGLRGILPRGATALWDALYAGALLASGPGRSLIVLFTDGQDNSSWLDAEALREVLERSNALVQVVSLDDDAIQFAGGATPSRPVELPRQRSLRELAELTGGRLWSAPSPDRLTEAFDAIAELMRQRYVLRFEPGSPRRPGLHPIDVRLVRRDGKVHCRRSYFVPADAN